MEELNTKANIYYIDGMDRHDLKPEVKDKIIDLMKDPSSLVVATVPKEKAEFDEDFVNYIK